MMDHEQVRKLRDDLGVSQAALARATGIHRTILSAFETGQLGLKGDCARRLRDFFTSRGVPLPEAPKPDQSILEELKWIEARIAEIESADCDKGFLDRFMEREREEREALAVFLQRARVLRQALHDGSRNALYVPDKPVTQADYLAHEYLKLRKKLAKSAS